MAIATAHACSTQKYRMHPAKISSVRALISFVVDWLFCSRAAALLGSPLATPSALLSKIPARLCAQFGKQQLWRAL